ncbi:alpha/beta fold hydrolase [Pyxidicoccus fallax]|nr:alpha/beta fold hydrolase [Pyxidicoccus fallax]
MDHRQKGGPVRQLAYERFGAGEGKKPLLVLHGGPGRPIANPGAFLDGLLVGATLRAHYDIVFFDQRGSGASLLPEEKDPAYVKRHARRYTIDQYVADIEALRTALFGRERKVTVLGSSWGGFLGLEYVLRHPEAVEAAMLGSFESTGRSTGDICTGFDRVLIAAEQQHAGLGRALARFRQAVADGKLVWHQGQPDQKPVRLTDAIGLAVPHAMKARHDELAQLLTQVVDGTPEGRTLLEGLEPGADMSVDLGGSLPGHATYCQELMSTAYARQLAEDAPATLYCDNKAFARGLLKTCEGFRPRARFHDNGARLASIRVPTLVFAGVKDPITPWEPSARTAALIPGATFVLIDGGHSPFKEGGMCLAGVVDRFARGERVSGVDCLRGQATGPLPGG